MSDQTRNINQFMILMQNKLLKSSSLANCGQILLPHFCLVLQISRPTLQRMDQYCKGTFRHPPP